MRNQRTWVHPWLEAFVGVTAGLLFLAAVTVGHAATEPQKSKAVQQPAPGQQLCPATPGADACKVVLDCPPGKVPGKDVCQTTVDCPDFKAPAKTQKKPKSR